MRKVAWDRGPVRLGTTEKADGTRVPMWHDSEVAAIAFAVQNILSQRARQRALVRQDTLHPAANMDDAAAPLPVMGGKKCNACGAHAVIKKDGCEFCTQCGELGSCG
jgi:ribonucleoside-diphosphate reductase alpha chain